MIDDILVDDLVSGLLFHLEINSLRELYELVKFRWISCGLWILICDLGFTA